MTGKIGANTHIAVGLSFLVVSVLLAAAFFGLIPDRHAAIRDGRIALSEAIAASAAEIASRGQVDWLTPTLRLVVKRNPEVLSAALRERSGTVVVEVGPHSAHWTLGAKDLSSEEQLHIPILAGSEVWGRLELRFTPISTGGLLGLISSPLTKLIAFVFFGALFAFFFYLRKVLRHLDPSGAVPSRVRNALDTLTEGLLVLDRKENVVLANRAFAEFLGQEPASLMGARAASLPWVTRSGDPLPPSLLPWTTALREAEQQVGKTLHMRGADGSVFTFQINCAPVLSEGGKAGGVLVSVDDITEIEENSIELEKAKHAADAANRAKSDFLSTMSHEIRTPMNAILGFTEVLRRGYSRDDQDAARHLNTIHSSGTHLLALINDILDLSKIEAGQLEVDSTTCSPYMLAHQVIQTLRVKAEEKAIALDLTVQGRLPEQIISDPARIRQVLTNLVGNAIKFTDQGKVSLSISLDTSDAEGLIRFRVEDSGIGISADSIGHIFDPFVQADRSVQTKFGGTGLGLAISRRIARALGGDIAVTSTPGVGSTFSVTFSAGLLEGVRLLDAQALEASLAAAIAPEKADRWILPSTARILVVDDGAENRELVATVLSESGVTPDEAENGQVAVDMAGETAYDLILMDMQMPVMDGFTATGILRQAGQTVPIVALTANAMRGFEQEIIAAGCTAYLTKPVDIDALIETIAKIVGGRREQEHSSTRQTPSRIEQSPASQQHPPASPSSPSGNASQTEAPANARPGLPPETPSGHDEGAGAIHSDLEAKPRLHRVIGKFVLRMRDQLPAFETALAQRDFGELASLAHWLKGAGGTVGFHVFTEPSIELEIAAKTQDAAGCDRAVIIIRNLSARLTAPDSLASKPPTTEANAAAEKNNSSVA